MTARSLPSNRRDSLARQILEVGGRWGAHAALVIGIVAIFLPLVLTLYISFFDETLVTFPPRGYTLNWYARIPEEFGEPIWTSLRIAVVAVFFALLVGVPAGIGLSRYRFPGRGLISTLLLAPLTVPGIAMGLGIYVFAIWVQLSFGMRLAGSLGLMILAHLLITLPWVVRLCLASLTNHDRSTEDAAASLGASPLMVIWRVTLPAMVPGIVAGGLFAFIVSFENLEMTIFLINPGTNTLPNAVLQHLTYSTDPLIAAVAVIQMAIVGAALLLLDRLVRLDQVAS